MCNLYQHHPNSSCDPGLFSGRLGDTTGKPLGSHYPAIFPDQVFAPVVPCQRKGGSASDHDCDWGCPKPRRRHPGSRPTPQPRGSPHWRDDFWLAPGKKADCLPCPRSSFCEYGGQPSRKQKERRRGFAKPTKSRDRLVAFRRGTMGPERDRGVSRARKQIRSRQKASGPLTGVLPTTVPNDICVAQCIPRPAS